MVSINRNGSQRVATSRRDRNFSISATACDSDRKESQGVANKFLTGFHMIAESRKQTWSLLLQLAATPCDSLRSYGNQALVFSLVFAGFRKGVSAEILLFRWEGMTD